VKRRKGERYTPPKIKQAKLVTADYWTLHAVARFVDPSDDVAALAQRMAVTCRKNNGLAVAAPQVGHDIRLVVLADGRAILNPSVEPDMTHGTSLEREGCLSYPNRWWLVERRIAVDVTGIDAFTGQPIGFSTYRGDYESTIDARMWQHEVDHLDGLVLVDRYEEVT